jgi:pimeloyl-ACP methyl ester carboxylesterase
MTDHTQVVIPSWLGEDGWTHAHAVLTPTSDTREKIVECRVGPVVPIIFLPGVMGTNLKSEEEGNAVWRPPNTDRMVDLPSAIFSLLAWWSRGPAERQTRLNPATTRIDDRGRVRYRGSGLRDEAAARARGWGEIHSESYHGFLCYLEAQLNNPMLHGEVQGDWAGPAEGTEHTDKRLPDASILMTAPSEFGATEPGPMLTPEALKHFAKYQYPVYAVGYNWLRSNGESAEYVFKRIRNICHQYGKDTKAIIVTHSMGGLVARAIAKLIPGGEALIYGVVHAAQPATGAPIAARRFRAGAEGFVGRALFGGNDAEWAAVAASSPAALELMPMPDYRLGAPWWRIQDQDGKVVMGLPKKSAEEEIYAHDAWYGLMPDPSVIDPAHILQAAAQRRGDALDLKDYFSIMVAKAVCFQRSVSEKYHPMTYVLYGDGELAVRSVISEKPEKLISFGTVTWRGWLPQGITEKELQAAILLEDDHRGGIKISIGGQTCVLTMQPPDEHGDGTVPTSSAAAQTGKSGVQQTFRQGGFDHQLCFNHPWPRWAALYAIGRIAQVIPKHEIRVKK